MKRLLIVLLVVVGVLALVWGPYFGWKHYYRQSVQKDQQQPAEELRRQMPKGYSIDYRPFEDESGRKSVVVKYIEDEAFERAKKEIEKRHKIKGIILFPLSEHPLKAFYLVVEPKSLD